MRICEKMDLLDCTEAAILKIHNFLLKKKDFTSKKIHCIIISLIFWIN